VASGRETGIIKVGEEVVMRHADAKQSDGLDTQRAADRYQHHGAISRADISGLSNRPINHSPESHLYCPLSGDDPFRPYNFNSRTMVPVRYTDEADVPTKLGLPTERMELVAYCGCHRLPPVTSCVQDIDPNEKFLAVFDIGDGVVKYATWDEIRDWITDPDEVRRLLEEGKRGIYR
jgi:hypothetical protein